MTTLLLLAAIALGLIAGIAWRWDELTEDIREYGWRNDQ